MHPDCQPDREPDFGERRTIPKPMPEPPWNAETDSLAVIYHELSKFDHETRKRMLWWLSERARTDRGELR